MPSLQLSIESIKQFEQSFMTAVTQRTGEQYESTNEAYAAYILLDEHKRQKFWEYVATNSKLPRERVYKFFRFTWSRQFYDSIIPYRDSIRNMVIEVLVQNNISEKSTSINGLVWNHIWSAYKQYNLHYDGTDQFVRNCVNLYFAKLQTDTPLQIIPVDTLPKPTEKRFADVSKPKNKPCIVHESDDSNTNSDAFGSVVEQIESCPPQIQGVDNYNYLGKEHEVNLVENDQTSPISQLIDQMMDLGDYCKDNSFSGDFDTPADQSLINIECDFGSLDQQMMFNQTDFGLQYNTFMQPYDIEVTIDEVLEECF